MEFQGFILDKFQEEAIESVEKNDSVLVSAPTGSGKTLIADYIIDKDLKGEKRIIYTAPIKALSNQKFKDFIERYGEDKIGLITGDLVMNPEAQVLIMTTEVYRNMAIIKDPVLDNVSYCIMDEIHFISDEERGYIWEESIIFSPEHIRFLFLSATIPNSKEFASWVGTIKKHNVRVVKHDERPVPLERLFYDSELGITTLRRIRERKELDKYPNYQGARQGRHQRPKIPPPDYKELVLELKHEDKLPCIYFVFSRAKTQQYAVKLATKSFLTAEEQKEVIEQVGEEFRKMSKDLLMLPSIQELRHCLSKGIAFHNAGLLPDMKHLVEHLFSQGLVKILFATETFAVGINMPAKTVCFDNLRKYTGTGFRHLTSKEYFQISGRAGRRGIDTKGISVAVIHRSSAEFDKIEEFTRADVLPLKSCFRLTYNTVLNMVHLHSEAEIQQILRMNFYTFQQLKSVKTAIDGADKRVIASIKSRFTKLVKTLIKLEYIKDGKLTRIGIFATKIFSNEIEISQMFAGEFNYELDEYTILLLIASLVYENKRETKFYVKYNTQKIIKIKKALSLHPVLRNGGWQENMEKMSALIDPCYNQKKFIDILKNTNLPEGDMIRLFMRIVDKLEQIDKALFDDPKMTAIVRNCKYLIKSCLEGIQVF
jgi:superfamily II RNA helicase